MNTYGNQNPQSFFKSSNERINQMKRETIAQERIMDDKLGNEDW